MPSDKSNLSVGSAKLNVEIADTLPKQMQGLSGRDSLCENCGMLFVYDRPMLQNFWMPGMKFPLDFIFIRDGKIMEFVENVQPMSDYGVTRIQSREPADMVLEVNRGLIRAQGINIGDTVDLQS